MGCMDMCFLKLANPPVQKFDNNFLTSHYYKNSQKKTKRILTKHLYFKPYLNLE